MSSSDPYATTSTVKNIVQHVISPKIVTNGSGGYVTKTDLVNIDNAVLSGNVSSSTTTTGGVVINSPSATATDITINVNSSTNWTVSHTPTLLSVARNPGSGSLQTAVTINRTTGLVTIPENLTVTKNITANDGVLASTVTSSTFVNADSGNFTNAVIAGSVSAPIVACSTQLQFSNTVATGNLSITNGNYTFGQNSLSTSGYALFNNQQAGVISWTGNSVGTRTVTGLNSSSIVTLTARNSGSLYGGGNFSVDTNTPDTLRVFTQNSGSYAFNYFVSRF